MRPITIRVQSFLVTSSSPMGLRSPAPLMVSTFGLGMPWRNLCFQNSGIVSSLQSLCMRVKRSFRACSGSSLIILYVMPVGPGAVLFVLLRTLSISLMENGLTMASASSVSVPCLSPPPEMAPPSVRSTVSGMPDPS